MRNAKDHSGGPVGRREDRGPLPPLGWIAKSCLVGERSIRDRPYARRPILAPLRRASKGEALRMSAESRATWQAARTKRPRALAALSRLVGAAARVRIRLTNGAKPGRKTRSQGQSWPKFARKNRFRLLADAKNRMMKPAHAPPDVPMIRVERPPAQKRLRRGLLRRASAERLRDGGRSYACAPPQAPPPGCWRRRRSP